MELINNLYAREILRLIESNSYERVGTLINYHPELKDSIFLFDGSIGGTKNLNGTTILHHAILSTNTLLVKSFLDMGVSANLENHTQFKAIDFAHYMAFTVFSGDDRRSLSNYKILKTFSEKENLDMMIDVPQKSDSCLKKLKI